MADEFGELLNNLKRKGVYGSALIDREGSIIKSNLPHEVHQETFGIMCATVIGAANSANSELDRGRIRRIIVDSREGKIIINSTEKNVILAVVVDSSEKLGLLFEEINKTINTLREQV